MAKRGRKPKEIRDGTKHCLSCNTWKLLSEMTRNRSTVTGYASVCKECDARVHRERVAKMTPEELEVFRQRNRDHALKRWRQIAQLRNNEQAMASHGAAGFLLIHKMGLDFMRTHKQAWIKLAMASYAMSETVATEIYQETFRR